MTQVRPDMGLLYPLSILDGKEAPYLLRRIAADVDDLLEECFLYNPRQVIKYLLSLVPVEVVSHDIENFLAKDPTGGDTWNIFNKLRGGV